MGNIETKQIIVTGDITLDKNIYKGLREKPEDNKYGTQIIEERGGAYLIYELVKKLTGEYTEKAIKKNNKTHDELDKLKSKIDDVTDKEEISKLKEDIAKKNKSFIDYYNTIFGLNQSIFDLGDKFPSCLETYANWEKYGYDIPKEFQEELKNKEKKSEKNIQFWKVSSLLGFGAEKIVSKDGVCKKIELIKNFYKKYKKDLSDIEEPEILVLDDGGNNFRNDIGAWKYLLYKNSKAKSKLKPKEQIKHIIIKSAYPVAHGELFKKLTEHFKEKLIIIVSIDEIRKEDVLVSKGVSWEQTALDLINELNDNQSIRRLLNCKHLIINFQSEGALYVEMDNKEIKKCRLVFDPEYLEGEWIKSKGIDDCIIGAMSCFTSAIVYGLLGNNLNIETTIIQALSAMRYYKIFGHGSNEILPEFPVEGICQEIITPRSKFASAFVPIPDSGIESKNVLKDGCGKEVDYTCFHNLNWTILEGNYRLDSLSQPLYDTGCRYALLGDKELANTPVLKMNKFVTYDRREIEALRNIINLAEDYINSKKVDKPLSIAVFGSSGSGKSFVVKQLNEHLKLDLLEFNLSQFVDVHELEGAFHQIRDIILKAKIPLVFWDEFDSQAYRWLQYLLAPMQDGCFQEGQLIHPIGKCIFIFAGATSRTYQTFGVKKPVYPKPKTPNIAEMKIKYEFDLKRHIDFILKKGPDFKSRLSGYLNVKGPNKLECLDENGDVQLENGNPVYDQSDIFFPIRRALIIRNRLGAEGSRELDIDQGLLNALIKIDKYEHGCRSIGQILSSLKSSNNTRFQRSNLPPFNVSSMLLNYKKFIEYLSEIKPFDFIPYKIAPEIHNNWKAIGDKDGWKLEYHKDYNYLPAHLKDENIAAARRISDILAIVGLMIVSKNEKDFYDEVNFEKILNKGNNLEKLAIEEHKRWKEFKELRKWDYNPDRNDDRKLHNCYCDWNKLIPKDQNKDKDAIRNYPVVLNAAGFIIVKKK
ncbi:MAG: ATP-binding protein [Candidatus Cloacimonetes bacterium]|nr:ATP-binding protein [Candidatus Cloacimonadota bacterium]